MNVIIPISLFALLLSYLYSRGYVQNGLKLAFVIITVIAMIRYDYGNDFMSYQSIFENYLYEFNYSKGFADFFQNSKEPGWKFLNMLCFPLGFGGLVAIHSLIINLIFYHFIKKYCPREWITLACFIYLFNSSLYLLHCSMMRQSLAMALILLTVDYLKTRRILPALILALVASTIHQSSIIIIPIIFLVYFLKRSQRKILTVLLLCTFILLFLSKDLLQNIFTSAVEFLQFEDYTNYKGAGADSKLGLGFILGLIPFAISLNYLYNNKDCLENNLIVLFSVFGTMLVPFHSIIPLIARLGIYFSAFTVVSFPIIYGKLKNKNMRIILLSLLLISVLVKYYQFFSPDSVFYSSYSHYTTIFS